MVAFLGGFNMSGAVPTVLGEDRAVMGGCLTEVRLDSVVVEHKGVPAHPQR